MNIPISRLAIAFFVVLMVSATVAAIAFPTHAISATLCVTLGGFLATLLALRRIRKAIWSIECGVRQDALLSKISVETHAMDVIMRRFPACSIPTSAWSMRFQNLHLLLDILDRRQPSNIVELGSGISTLLIASWLQEKGGGRLVSVDHDESWAARTEFYLKSSGLEDFATIKSVGLKQFMGVDQPTEWYDFDSVMKNVSEIDLLLVDGPPAGSPRIRLSRAPAMHLLVPHFSPDCCVVLDDAHRVGEAEVIRRWKEAFPDFNFQIISTITGLAIGERTRRDRLGSRRRTTVPQDAAVPAP